MMAPTSADLLEGVLGRHIPSVARAISMLESRRPGYVELADAIWSQGGRARIIGITGAPGTGKSTLCNTFVTELRRRQRTVGVVAVDPSSSLTGGAILGDRIRMSGLTSDDSVFVRSLSSRGSLGGVSRATVDAVAVLDAAGFDHVIIETVGVGQAEVDIVQIAHAVVVVSVPGLGDDIQMIKAGLIEVADVHVVNKADRPDANRTVAELRSMIGLALSLNAAQRDIPIVETVATTGCGVDRLADTIERHFEWLESSGQLQTRQRASAGVRVREIAKEMLMEAIGTSVGAADLDDVMTAVAARRLSPYSAASRLLTTLGYAEPSLEAGR